MNQIATDDGKFARAQPFAAKREVSREPFLPLFILFIENTAKSGSRERGGGRVACLPGSVYVKVIDMQID